MSKVRKIIIGDTHGCYDETIKLLELCEYNPSRDRLFFTGDLINRGPDSKGCYELYKKYSARAPIGNHELELINISNGEKPESSRTLKLKKEFGKEYFQTYLDDIKTWPLWIEEDEFILLHAGIEPGKSIEEQSVNALTKIRKCEDPKKPGGKKPWFDFYTGQKPIVFGHWSLLGGLIRENLYGIDMGCVYGRYLRAIIFPEKKIIDVPAKHQYYNPD